MADPVLKWPGGKRQLLDELSSFVPSSFDIYIEPFMGGGAFGLSLEPEQVVFGDINARLITFYEQVRTSPQTLIEQCQSFQPPDSPPDPDLPFHDRDRKGRAIDAYYYQQRALFNRRPAGESFDPLEEAARLLYLNRTAYNGLYRENQDGFFNAPIGRYDDPDWVQAEAVEALHTWFQSTSSLKLEIGDFEETLQQASDGDLVYVDPPYKPMSASAQFTEYDASGFDSDDQRRLLEALESLDERGVHFIASNSGVMYDRYSTRDWTVRSVDARRSINCDGSNRGEVDEIIATNIPPHHRSRPSSRQLVLDGS